MSVTRDRCLAAAMRRPSHALLSCQLALWQILGFRGPATAWTDSNAQSVASRVGQQLAVEQSPFNPSLSLWPLLSRCAGADADANTLRPAAFACLFGKSPGDTQSGPSIAYLGANGMYMTEAACQKGRRGLDPSETPNSGLFNQLTLHTRHPADPADPAT